MKILLSWVVFLLVILGVVFVQIEDVMLVDEYVEVELLGGVSMFMRFYFFDDFDLYCEYLVMILVGMYFLYDDLLEFGWVVVWVGVVDCQYLVEQLAEVFDYIVLCLNVVFDWFYIFGYFVSSVGVFCIVVVLLDCFWGVFVMLGYL